MQDDPALFLLKVTLEGIRPPIWRRVLVPSDLTLAKLHHVLQIAMGWTNSHLHQFVVGNAHYGVPDPAGPNVENEKRVTLGELIVAGDRFLYEYDFGDGWVHKVAVEKAEPASPLALFPRCLEGRRACPPEDCGGTGGYTRLVEILRDPKHPEHQETQAWLGGPFNPEAFDLDPVNAAIEARARRWRRRAS